MIGVGGWPSGRRNVRICGVVGLLLASGDGVVGLLQPPRLTAAPTASVNNPATRSGLMFTLASINV